MAHRLRVVGLLALVLATACTREEKSVPPASSVPEAGSAAPAGPKNLDLAKAGLLAARAKYAKHEVVDADCPPLRSLEADFAHDKSPDSVKTRREIDVFCEIDVKLEGSLITLKGDQEKLTAAQKKKDKTAEQMYAATVKDGCTNIRQHLESLASDHLDGEPKVSVLKADADRICSPAPARKN